MRTIDLGVRRLILALGLTLASQPAMATATSPNIVLIITDDQGYGDLGIHDNPKIKTPNLDRFARQSVRVKNFFVSPVCAPTRASLMTGRYNYRTGVVDTYIGRALMHPDEVTLPEALARAGYRTGIFGKWHLGDNAPLRPIDQGFQEALVIKGGGIGQPSDPPGGESYFNPILQHNGRPERIEGYCTEIFASAAIEFIGKSGGKPFFTYLAFNCPHDPLEVPDSDLAPYRSMNLALSEFPHLGQRIPPGFASPVDSTARVYAMISNIDRNIGRLLDRLDELKLGDNTIVVFMTDNGPAGVRFNAGLRGWKGSVYDGGIHVPCYIRWPGHFPAGHEVDRIAAHIDLMPTLLDAVGVSLPSDDRLDGKSLLPLLSGIQKAGWPDRTLYFQWQRRDRPDPDLSFAARSQDYKLLRHDAIPGAPKPPGLELYDMVRDPYELHDISGKHPEIVRQMYADYRKWFDDVSSTRGFEPVRIEIGGPRENPTVLNRQDWRGPRAGWNPNDLGYWEINVVRAGRYQVALRFAGRPFPTMAHLQIGGSEREVATPAMDTGASFGDVNLSAGPSRLEAWVEGNNASAGVLDVTVKRLGD